MKKILVIAFRFPYPLIDGSRIRIYNICKILAQEYCVDLLVVEGERIPEEYLKELQKFLDKVVVFSFHPLRFKLNLLKGLFSYKPFQVHYYFFREVQEWIGEHYSEYDLFFCFHIRMAEYFQRELFGLGIIDMIDATSINYSEGRQIIGKGVWKFAYSVESERLLAYELKVLGKFDQIYISSGFDENYLRKKSENPKNNLVLVSNGVSEEIFNRFHRNQEEENYLVFLGKMNYAPNVDAVVFFVREVFPRIRREADVKLLIVGTNPAKSVVKLQSVDGVDVTGYVEDPYKYLGKSKMVIAPLRFSAGMQYKVLEAMAWGKTVVTTTKCARSIKGRDGEHFVIADDSDEMVSKILRLLKDEPMRIRIGMNARKLVGKFYKWEIIGEKLLREINRVLSSPS